jgi:hypothetical protein
MKFSDIERDNWEELRPFVDTCLLPLSGLTGAEQPWEVTQALERLRDILDLVEIPFKGRTVTYPAIHYSGDQETAERLCANLCMNLKRQGFRFVIVVSANRADGADKFPHADLVIVPPGEEDGGIADLSSAISAKIQKLWAGTNGV